jgi:hypothetical protein
MGAIVVNNGALVKDLASGETVQHAYLPPEVFDDVVDPRALARIPRSSTSTPTTTRRHPHRARGQRPSVPARVRR